MGTKQYRQGISRVVLTGVLWGVRDSQPSSVLLAPSWPLPYASRGSSVSSRVASDTGWFVVGKELNVSAKS